MVLRSLIFFNVPWRSAARAGPAMTRNVSESASHRIIEGSSSARECADHGASGPRLEPEVRAEPAHHDRAHGDELVVRVQRLVETRVHHLQVEGHVEPGRDD